MSTSNPAVGQPVLFTDTSVKGSGTITQWSWNFGDGQTSSAQNPSHSYSTLGAKTVTLTVIDTNSRSATSKLTLNVVDYASPTASFTWDPPTTPAVNSPVQFRDTSAAGSGTIIQWSWNFGDNSPLSTVQNPTHTYSSNAQNTVSLTITDSNGKTSTATKPINVGNVVAPIADFTISNSNPNVGQTITFTDVSVPGSSGTINQWSWNFGDGTPTSTPPEPNPRIHCSGSKNRNSNSY